MKYWSILLTIFAFSCNQTTETNSSISPEVSNSDSIVIEIQDFEIPNTTIRAIKAVSEDVVWFAGSNGKYGYTSDGGVTWEIKQFVKDSVPAHFRSLEINDEGELFLVSIENPASIYRSSDTGKTWTTAYSTIEEGSFFDDISIHENHGILLGDPINSCFYLLESNDKGKNWNRIACDNLPISLAKEAPFAASNSNLITRDSNIWFATGGESGSRVYSSSDFGKSWNAYYTPIISGQTMTGIFAMDFFNSEIGVVAGGDWENPEKGGNNIALTKDGGKSWSLIDTANQLGYVSGVHFVPNSNSMEILTLTGRGREGFSQMAFSQDQGMTWQILPNSNYISLDFASPNVVWVSGKNKIGRMVIKRISIAEPE